ncbi:hypothetical protein POM88_011544 [Heracleum sosnowskyi]|uniref:Transposase MuDR plant domain-containing protein n=1 Tax=Heracleum sosnowskyi TaxID=360622 RepID=A0AAD8IX04_9APIA|nr:hypothetical protein POM88_011544 [Heracleum sosnowskyi]
MIILDSNPEPVELKSPKKEKDDDDPFINKKKPTRTSDAWDHFTKIVGGNPYDPSHGSIKSNTFLDETHSYEFLEVEEDARYMNKLSMDDNRPTFRLGMTFSNAFEVREAITKYGISQGVSLKYVKNKPSRLRVKCEKGCPFSLFVSKDGNQPGLRVKTFLEEHNCFRIFNNARCSTRFIASHFKSRILNRVDYKVKDMKSDAEAELRCNVFFKYKRAKKIVLDEFSGRFTTEFSDLEPYAVL